MGETGEDLWRSQLVGKPLVELCEFGAPSDLLSPEMSSAGSAALVFLQRPQRS